MELLVIVIILGFCLFIAFTISKSVNKDKRKEYGLKKAIDDARKEYMKKYNLYKRDAFITEVVDFDNYIKLDKNQKTFWVFKEDNNLCLVSKNYNNDIGKVTINIDNIKKFGRFGDIDSYTKISGGDGGGSSIGKAIVGGMVAGEVGAIVASRKKVNEIKTERVVNDERITILEVDKEGKNCYIKLTSKSFDSLIRLIPEKELNFINNIEIV